MNTHGFVIFNRKNNKAAYRDDTLDQWMAYLKLMHLKRGSDFKFDKHQRFFLHKPRKTDALTWGAMTGMVEINLPFIYARRYASIYRNRKHHKIITGQYVQCLEFLCK